MHGIASPLRNFVPSEAHGRVVFPLFLDNEAFQRYDSAAPLAAARRCHSALYQHSLSSYSRLFTLCATGITKEPGNKKQFVVGFGSALFAGWITVPLCRKTAHSRLCVGPAASWCCQTRSCSECTPSLAAARTKTSLNCSIYRRVTGVLQQHILPEAAQLHRAQQPASSGGASAGASVRSAGASSTPSADSHHKNERRTTGQRLLAPAALRSGEGGGTASRKRGATEALLSHAMASGGGRSQQHQAARSHQHTNPRPQVRPQPLAAPANARRGTRVRSARAQELAISLMQQQPAAPSSMTSAASASARQKASTAAQLLRRAIERFAPEIGNDRVLTALLRGVQVAPWSAYTTWLRKRCSECSLMSLFHDIVPASSSSGGRSSGGGSRPFMAQIDVGARQRLEACVELMDRVSVKQTDGSVKRTYNAYMLVPEATALHACELSCIVQAAASPYHVPRTVGPITHTALQSEDAHQEAMRMHASVLVDVDSSLRPRYRHPYVTYSAVPVKLHALQARCQAAARCSQGPAEQHNTQGSAEEVAQSESLKTSRQSEGGREQAQGGDAVAQGTAQQQPLGSPVVESTVRLSAKETQLVRTQAATVLNGSVLGKTWAPSAARTDAASAPVRAAAPPKKPSQARTTKYCELCRVDYEVLGGDRGAHFASAAHQRRLHQTVLSADAVGAHCLLTKVQHCESSGKSKGNNCKACSISCRFVYSFVGEHVQRAVDALAQLRGQGARTAWDMRPETLKRVAALNVFKAVDAWTQWAAAKLQGGGDAAPGSSTGLLADRAVYWTLCLRSKMGTSPHPSTLLSLMGELQPLQGGEGGHQELSPALAALLQEAAAAPAAAQHNGPQSQPPAQGECAPSTNGPLVPVAAASVASQVQTVASTHGSPQRKPTATTARGEAAHRSSGSTSSSSSGGSDNSSSSGSGSGSSSSSSSSSHCSSAALSAAPAAVPTAHSVHSATQVDTALQPGSQASETDVGSDAPSQATEEDAATEVASIADCRAQSPPPAPGLPPVARASPRRSPRRPPTAAATASSLASSQKTSQKGRRFARWRGSSMLSPTSAAAKHAACSTLGSMQQRSASAKPSSGGGGSAEAPSAPPAVARQGALVASRSNTTLTRAPRVNHRATSHAIVVSSGKRRRSLPRMPSTTPPPSKARKGGVDADAAAARTRVDSFELPQSPGGSPFGFDSSSPRRSAPSAPAQERLRLTRRRISAARGRDLASPPKAF